MARRRSSPVVAFLVISLLLSVCLVLVLRFYLGVPLLWAWLIGINLTTIAAYGYDKSIAGGSSTRVPERILHTLAFVGGTPAALLSQRLFRHKTVKGSFQLRFWTIAILQVVLVVVWVFWLRYRI